MMRLAAILVAATFAAFAVDDVVDKEGFPAICTGIAVACGLWAIRPKSKLGDDIVELARFRRVGK